jgi:CRP-like cAMP-binding protein
VSLTRFSAAPRLAAGEEFWPALKPPDQAALLAAGATRRFARGRALMHDGQSPDIVMLVRSGHVKIVTVTPTGREVVLAIRGAGELVGELSALDARPRSASAIALEDVEALVLSPSSFRGFLAAHPDASMALLGMLARRLRDADAKRAGFSALTTMGRVAERLLELAERFGVEEDGGILIKLRLSQEELAGWTGASLESVGRALATMRSVGWIETRRREIRVLDIEALRRAVA